MQLFFIQGSGQSMAAALQLDQAGCRPFVVVDGDGSVLDIDAESRRGGSGSIDF